MLGKPEVKGVRPRGDGRHCDLCGCSFPAVRCDKCGSQIFCLSCDDMYHRHPKRRFHLRKAVDPTPTPQARPVLPMKVSQLSSAPGDPSKMPLPPPRKKKPGKSFFDTFRRGSPSSDNSPPLPKKEYSWSDRLGSIKKFMSNRPLPPIPKDEDNQEQRISPQVPRKNDLSFIHKRVDEKPPQLPHRTQAKSPSRKLSGGDLLPINQKDHSPDKPANWTSSFGSPIGNFQQTPPAPSVQHLNGQASRDSSERELSSGRFRSRSLQDDTSPTGIPNFLEPQNLTPTMPPDVRGYSTLKRPPSHGQDFHNQSFMSVPGDIFPGMHTSSSVTDLHTLDSPSVRGPQHFPNFPMPPHYPHAYPMYPHYPNYPQYFGTSFANLTTALPNTDGDFSDHSDASSFSSNKHHKHSAFGIKAKRSQSVMYDRTAYPPQYYPFGGFPPHPPLPGYGAAPWGQSDHPVEAPPSPAASVRSFGRSHRSRHRKKKMVASDNDDDDERLSVRSSPRSRTTSSSDRLRKRKTPKKFERSMSPSSLTSSEEEEDNQTKEDRLSPEVRTDISQGDGYQTKQDKKKVNKQAKDSTKSENKCRQHGSRTRPVSHQKLKTDDKNFSPKFKKKERTPLSSGESMDVTEEQVQTLQKTDVQDQPPDAEMKEQSDYCSEKEDDVKVTQMDEPATASAFAEGQWQCEHCTFINGGECRICQVCCKTKPGLIPPSDSTSLQVPEVQASSSAAASPDIPTLNTTSESLTSDTAKEYLTPPAAAEEDSHSAQSENEGQNFEKLNSDLEQAEKELSRGLMELMKLKEESDIASAQTVHTRRHDDILANREALVENTQPEPKPAVIQIETTVPKLSAKVETPTEQTNHYPNIPKVENVSSKSIGTDSMDFDFPTHQGFVPQNRISPVSKTSSLGVSTQDEVSPANSFSEILSAAAPTQKGAAAMSALRRDSSCQTYQEDSIPQIENEIPPLSHADNMDFQYQYGRMDAMKSPQLPPVAPSSYRGFGGRGGQGLMYRSHSRSSLFGDRYNEARAAPSEFDNLGFGFGPSPMYRSLSRSSLTGDFSDPWMTDARSLRRPDFYLSMEELVERRRLETKRAQGLELVRMIREAEQQGFTADDIHVALNNCGKQNPMEWLQTNWRGMVDTVVTLATNYGKDKHENDIGVLSENEARDALRMHKGNIWAAVTECVEGRQRKFLELRARGNFSTKEIVDALTQSEGNVELAYTRLSATTLKPFLMRIWGAGEGVENQDGAVCDPSEFLDPASSGWPKDSPLRAGKVPSDDAERCSDQEDWDDDDDVEEEVSWNEDEEDEMENPENFEVEPQIVNREKRGFISNHIATPESDSEYCDAFDPLGDARSATSSSPCDEIFYVSPDSGMESQKEKKKGVSFLSRLAALRKNKKPHVGDTAEKNDGEADSGDSSDIMLKREQGESKIPSSDVSPSSTETNKIYGPLNILKQTFSAIKDSVIGSNNKNEAKHPRSITEARTIIVHDRAGHETLLLEECEDKSMNGNRYNVLLAGDKRKNVNIPKISDDPEPKQKQSVRRHRAENIKDSSESNILPVASAVIADAEICNASTSSEKMLATQQNGRHAECTPEAENVTETSVTPEVLKQQQDTSDSSAGSESHVKCISPTTKQPCSKKSEEYKFPTQEKSTTVSDKVSDSVCNSAVDLTQNSLDKSAGTMSSNEVAMESRAQNDYGGEILPANVATTGVADDTSASLASDINEAKKPSDKISTKSNGAKLKTKRLREGLSLKLPDLGKMTNSEIPEDQSNTAGQDVELLDKTDTNSKTDVGLDETQKTVEQQNGRATTTTTAEIHSGLVDVDKTFGKLKENQSTNSYTELETEPAGGEDVTDINQKNEEKSVASEETKINISENEFHDMASKIAEKMENCLEVLKSGETSLTESNQNIPSNSEKEKDAANANGTAQIETNSSEKKSEIVNEDTDKFPSTPKLLKDQENKEDSDAKSLDDNKNQVTDKVRESSASPAKSSSSKTIEKDAVADSRLSVVQPNTSKAEFGGNMGDTLVTNNISEDSSAVRDDGVSIAKAGSPVSQMVSSPPITIHSENSTEFPVAFPGVKAKTFTRVLNKKAKNQLPGSDKKQKEISARSLTSRKTPGIAQDDKALVDKADSLVQTQTPNNITGTHKDEDVAQPHQSETGSHVHSIVALKEETISSVANDQLSQIVSGEIKSETSSVVQTSHQTSSSGEPSSSEVLQLPKPTEVDPLKSSASIDSEPEEGTNDSKLNDASSSSHEKDKDAKSTSSVANSEVSLSSSRKVSGLDSQTKKQDIKMAETADVAAVANVAAAASAPGSTGSEESVSTSSKGSEKQASEQDTAKTLVEAGSEATVSILSKGSESQAEGQETKGISVENSEASVPSSSKDSENQAKEQNRKGISASDITEASGSFSSKISDSQAKEQDAKNTSAEVNSEPLVLPSSQVPSSSKNDKLDNETTSVKEDNVPSSPVASRDKRPASRVEALKNSFADVNENSQGRSQSPLRPQSPFGRMASLNARKEAIAQERNKEIRKTPTLEKKPWFLEKVQPPKPAYPKRSIKQQLEFERKIRKLVSDRKCRTYRKAEIVVQLMEMNFAEEEALQAAHECSTLEQAISYLQQECLLCTGMYPVGQIVSMIHCPHKACRECIKAYFTIQIRDRTIMELLCPFCNEPDISDEDVAQDYFNHLDILLKKLVESEIHELFQRKLRDRVLMKDPNFRWCSQCSSGFIAMPNLKRLICPDCNAITCASCRRPWEREHEGVSCEAFAAWKDANDPEAQAAGLAKLLQEDGIDCPNCHFRYFLAKGGCMHFRCIQCQHDFCSGCSRPFKMGQKCGVSEFCGKLGLHAHHPRNCLFYLRDKDPEDLQKLLELNDIEYNKDLPEGMELNSVCQVMEQKETSDGLVDDTCGKEVSEGQAGLCRVHYVEYLGQLVNKHKVDPIQIFCNDDLELVLRRASKRLPAKSYRDTEVKYREKLVQLIQEELPLELTEGS